MESTIKHTREGKQESAREKASPLLKKTSAIVRQGIDETSHESGRANAHERERQCVPKKESTRTQERARPRTLELELDWMHTADANASLLCR